MIYWGGEVQKTYPRKGKLNETKNQAHEVKTPKILMQWA